LKKKSNHETRTTYSLLISNCHLFVLEIDGLLGFPDGKKKDVITYFKKMQQRPKLEDAKFKWW
jgi:hypothetical protein